MWWVDKLGKYPTLMEHERTREVKRVSGGTTGSHLAGIAVVPKDQEHAYIDDRPTESPST